MSDTGNGATLTLSSTGSLGVVRSMTLPEFTIPDVEDSALTTAGFVTYIAGDLAEGGEMTVEYIFDASADDIPSFGTAETATVTFPIHTSGNTNNATFVATGYVKGWKMPDMANNELQVANMTFKIDGKTDPAFTAES